ncbi:MAG: MFS transporter [Syntrophomonadaceae bacterium]
MVEKPASLEKYALAAVMSTSFMVTFMGSSINLALPSIGAEFQAGAIMSSWVITGYILSTAALLLPFGHLADIIGRRKIYLLGTFSFAIVTIASTLAHSIVPFLIWRILQGVSAALIFGTGMAILTSVYPPQKRGQALGYSTSVTYLGLSVGPVLGGIMNQNLGWRSIFYLTACIGIFAALIIWKRLEGEWAGASSERFDRLGSLFYALGLSILLYGLSSLANVSWAKYAAIGGLLLLLVFMAFELKIDHPILQASLFSHNQAFTFSNLAALINYSATFAISFLLSLYLQLVIGYNSGQAGLILLVQPVIMAVFSPLSGSLSDHIEPRLVASLGMGLSTLGLFGLAFVSANTHIGLIIALQVLSGLGFALFSSPNTNAVMSSVQPRFYGIASSTLGTMRLVGQASSMAIVTMVIAIYIGHASFNASNAPAVLSSMHTSFRVFTVLCILGVFASLARGSVRPTPAEKQAAS